jgi:hypothetical protein
VSPIGGERCTARGAGRPTWRVTERVERLARASRAGDQQSLLMTSRKISSYLVRTWYRTVGAVGTVVTIGPGRYDTVRELFSIIWSYVLSFFDMCVSDIWYV